MCLLERLDAGRKYDVTKRKTGNSMEKITEPRTYHMTEDDEEILYFRTFSSLVMIV